MADKLSMEAQIAELEYTFDAVQKWYAHQVNARHMRQSEAEMHETRLRAAINTMYWLDANAAVVRDAYLKTQAPKNGADERTKDPGEAAKTTTDDEATNVPDLA